MVILDQCGQAIGAAAFTAQLGERMAVQGLGIHAESVPDVVAGLNDGQLRLVELNAAGI